MQPVGAVAPANAVDDGVRKATQAARQAYSEHDYAAAVAHYEEALKLGAKLSPRLRIALLSNYGAALRESHKFPEAADAFKKAIGLAEQAHIERDAAATTAMKQYAVLLRRMGQNMDADAMEARAAGVTAGNAGAGRSSSIATAADAALEQQIDQQPLVLPPDKAGGTPKQRRLGDISLDEMKQIADAHPNDFGICHALAYKYMMLKDWPNALSNYESLKERFPNSRKQIRSELAECYAKNDRMSAAIDELKMAVSEDADDRTSYLQLISCYCESGDLRSGVDQAKVFVEKFPDDRNIAALNDMIDHFQRDLKSASSTTTTQPKSTERKYSWPLNFFPLKVYIYPFEGLHMAPSASGITARSPGEVVASACDAWTQGTRGKIVFVTVQRPEEANIEVQFTTERQEMESEAALGVTKRSGYGEVPKARIYLLATGSDGGDIVPEDLYHTCLHELGHALSLEHSTDPHDIMYPSHMANVVQLTEHDCQRAIVLYTR
jgi:tetratricopeptide (TPR) repeat protein